MDGEHSIEYLFMSEEEDKSLWGVRMEFSENHNEARAEKISCVVSTILWHITSRDIWGDEISPRRMILSQQLISFDLDLFKCG